MEYKKGIHLSGDLECAILGVCMLEKEAFARTIGLLEKENFYYSGNQIIYDALAEMYSNGVYIELLTVYD